MLRFSVSLGFLFSELPLLARFAAAREAGFGAVEFSWPEGIAPSELELARNSAGVEVALFNMFEGDFERGERGFASDPGRRGEWRERCDLALELAQILECHRINVLTGDLAHGGSRPVQLACLVENLRWAAPRAERAEVILVVEPLNAPAHPQYLCQRTADVLDVLDQVGAANVMLQYDCYHAQRTEGDIVNTIRTQSARMGHVQIADVPGRHEPGTGELNYGFILDELQATGYSGFVGLEYLPRAGVEDPFAWLPRGARG